MSCERGLTGCSLLVVVTVARVSAPWNATAHTQTAGPPVHL